MSNVNPFTDPIGPMTDLELTYCVAYLRQYIELMRAEIGEALDLALGRKRPSDIAAEAEYRCEAER